MNARRVIEGGGFPSLRLMRALQACPPLTPSRKPNPRYGRLAAAALAIIGMAIWGNTALYAQAGVARFVNNTPFTVRIVAG